MKQRERVFLSANRVFHPLNLAAPAPCLLRGQTYSSHEVYIYGIACWAEEARFGNIVVQPL